MQRSSAHTFEEDFLAFMQSSMSHDDLVQEGMLSSNSSHHSHLPCAEPSTLPLNDHGGILSTELIKAMNMCDVGCLREFFYSHCHPDCVVTHQVMMNPETLTFTNPLGNFQSVQFPNLPFYFQFMENFFLIFPDSVIQLDIFQPLQAVHVENDIVVSGHSFNWFGTSVVSDTRLLHIDSHYQGVHLLDKSNDFLSAMYNTYSFPRNQMKGILYLYVDSHCLIQRLEFHYY